MNPRSMIVTSLFVLWAAFAGCSREQPAHVQDEYSKSRQSGQQQGDVRGLSSKAISDKKKEEVKLNYIEKFSNPVVKTSMATVSEALADASEFDPSSLSNKYHRNINQLHYSLDDRALFSAEGSGFYVWDVVTKRRILSSKKKKYIQSCQNIFVASDGNRVFTLESGYKVRILDIKRRKYRSEIDFYPTIKAFGSGLIRRIGEDANASMWVLITQKEGAFSYSYSRQSVEDIFTTENRFLYSGHFTRDGRYAVLHPIGGESQFIVWDRRERVIKYEPTNRDVGGYIQTVTLHPADNVSAIIMISDILVLNLETQKIIQRISFPRAARIIQFTENGKYLAAAAFPDIANKAEGYSVYLFDWRTGKKMVRIGGQAEQITAFAINHAVTQAAIADGNGVVRFYEIETGALNPR